MKKINPRELSSKTLNTEEEALRISHTGFSVRLQPPYSPLSLAKELLKAPLIRLRLQREIAVSL